MTDDKAPVAEAVAWLHTMTYETSETNEKLSFSDESEMVWGIPGKDYSTEYLVEIEPLYPASALSALQARAEAAEREIERLKNLLGDPEGTIAHADAITATADKAEARARRLEEALREAQKLSGNLWHHSHYTRDGLAKKAYQELRHVLHAALSDIPAPAQGGTDA